MNLKEIKEVCEEKNWDYSNLKKYKFKKRNDKDFKYFLECITAEESRKKQGRLC